MTAIAMRRGPSLTIPLSISLVLHVAAVVALVFVKTSHHAAMPVVYRVLLVAAPAGERAIGVVNPPKAAVAKTPPAARTPQKVPPKTLTPAPVKTAAQPTPVPKTSTSHAPATPQPKAGGGPEGGKGSDVGNVRIDSDREFPDQAYLDNIVTQIQLNFRPQGVSPGSPLRAEVVFLILRDGTVKNIRLTTPSGSYGFDVEARGAVEAVGKVKGFGPLPTAFTDDVLPVTFSFDPRIIR